MKLLTRLMLAILLGLAISITIKNYTLQSELDQIKEDEVRTEWVKAAKANHENKNIIVVEDGKK